MGWEGNITENVVGCKITFTKYWLVQSVVLWLRQTEGTIRQEFSAFGDI